MQNKTTVLDGLTTQGDAALRLLKSPLRITGVVVAGEKVGRTIGFPTANLELERPPQIKLGVYAAFCEFGKERLLGLAYYGPRHIFNHVQNSFEVYLLNWHRTIYRQKLAVTLTHWLRPPKPVRSLPALKKLLTADLKQMTHNQVVIVNRQDQPLGIDSVEQAHQGQGRLHRAISVYLFNSDKKLLIQKRSSHKRLWPLIWANSCCSHPRPDESYAAAGERRLQEELGIKAKLKLVDQLIYQAQYKNLGSEHELDLLLIGVSDQQPRPNPKEISSWQYIDLKTLRQKIKRHPENFAPWFKLGLKRLRLSDIFKA